MVVVAQEEFTEEVNLSARNIANVFYTYANNASVYELLVYKNLVLSEGAIKYFEEVLN
jgi:large subunit ribosomal protein L4